MANGKSSSFGREQRNNATAKRPLRCFQKFGAPQNKRPKLKTSSGSSPTTETTLSSERTSETTANTGSSTSPTSSSSKSSTIIPSQSSSSTATLSIAGSTTVSSISTGNNVDSSTTGTDSTTHSNIPGSTSASIPPVNTMGIGNATTLSPSATSHSVISTKESIVPITSNGVTSTATESSSVPSSAGGMTTTAMQPTRESTGSTLSNKESTLETSTGTDSSSVSVTVATEETTATASKTPPSISASSMSETSTSTLSSLPITHLPASNGNHTTASSGSNSSAVVTSPGTTPSVTTETTSVLASNIFTITLAKTDDGTSAEIPVSGNIPVYGTRYKHIHVSINGLVSLGNNTVGYNPRPLPIGTNNTVLLAPFWTDLDIRNTTDSSVYATVYQNVQHNTNITKEWLPYLEPGFNPTWAVDVHWEHVSPYPAEIYHKKENTSFRLVLLSDGDRTFAAYDYDKNNALPYSLARTPVIGLDFGSDGYRSFFNRTGTPEAVDISKTVGNIGLIGKWIFKLYNESTVSNATATCRDWLTQESRDIVSSPIPACPCSTTQIFADPKFYFDNATYCADIVVPTENGYGLHCCYNPTDTPVRGSLMTGPRGPSAFYRFHPETFPALHKSRDIYARDACCTEEETCKQYYARRIVSSCSNYIPPIIASVFGSPNLQTFDGLQYTFGGNGEYLLAETNTGSVLQTKMEPIWIKGDSSQPNDNLTVFSSFTISGSTDVTVSQNDKRTGIDIKVDGASLTNSFEWESNFRRTFQNLTVYKNSDDCVVIVETAGFSTKFCDAGGSISAVVVTPPEAVRNTRGLLGTANNDKSDDLSLRDTTVEPLSLNSTDRKIFSQMQSWRVSPDTNTSLHQNLTINATDVTPLFLDELYPNIYNDENSTDYIACLLADAMVSKACLYHRLVLKDETTANQTLAIASKIANQKHVLQSRIPPLETSEGRIVNVTVGKEMTLYLKHMPSVIGRCNTDLNATCTDNGTGVMFTWTPASLATVHLSFTAVDNTLGLVSETVAYEIHICDCSGHGTCRFDRFLPNQHPMDNFRLASCDCEIGWTGHHCELDFDGCQGAPCVSWGSNCTDLTPAEQRQNKHPYRCSECPSGYRRIQTDCFEIDECQENTTLCDNEPGVCINTNGNYTCQCPRSTFWNGSVCISIPEPSTSFPESTTVRSPVDLCGYYNGTQMCENNGTCQLQNTNDSICVCTPGYHGDLCELRSVARATDGDWVVEILLPAAAAVAIATAALCCLMAVVRRRRKKRSLDEESDQDSFGVRGSYAVPSSIFLPRFNTNWRQFYGSPSTWNDTAPTVHRDRPLQFPITYPYDNETNSSVPTNSFDDRSLDTSPEWCNNVLLQEDEFNIGRPIYKTERIYPHLPDDSY
ncbi:mucin-like protein [Pecten maximus]|uniref:mucin-like protein n=1 Tax=Pecten maximus TaxID=6579 RepID=UPI001458CB0A|nr:mucin-like protein [Pecten maximus]